MGMLETDPRIETGVLPLLERLRGSLRLMFHPEHRYVQNFAPKQMILVTKYQSCSDYVFILFQSLCTLP